MKTTSPAFHFSDFLWDVWCVASVVGIWPRFIEPNLIEENSLTVNISSLAPALEGFKVLQFSDIHLHSGVSDRFLKKLTGKILAQAPDMIVFTGDFLCYAKTDSLERLQSFLNTLHAPYGCFAALGNHDYEAPVSINEKGEYDIQTEDTSLIKKGFARLFSMPTLAKKTTVKALETPPNALLIEMLKKTPFHLLHNENTVVPVKDTFLNISGLGEYTMGRTLPEKTFENYSKQHPGITLLHNPDGIRMLADSPGNLILCGHTHGGQVNLPWMWKRFTLMEDMRYIKGLHRLKDKIIYINRGIGSVMTFRWFARPEILLTTLRGNP